MHNVVEFIYESVPQTLDAFLTGNAQGVHKVDGNTIASTLSVQSGDVCRLAHANLFSFLSICIIVGVPFAI